MNTHSLAFVRLHKTLLKIKKDVIFNKQGNHGICYLIEDYYVDRFIPYEGVKLILNKLFVLWPKFSGDVCYPVPSTHPYKNNLECFITEYKWNMKKDYGKMRHELLDWLIEKTRNNNEDY